MQSDQLASTHHTIFYSFVLERVSLGQITHIANRADARRSFLPHFHSLVAVTTSTNGSLEKMLVQAAEVHFFIRVIASVIMQVRLKNLTSDKILAL